MIEITPALREQVGCKGLGVSLFSEFEQQGVEQMHGYLANVLEDCRVEPCIVPAIPLKS